MLNKKFSLCAMLLFSNCYAPWYILPDGRRINIEEEQIPTEDARLEITAPRRDFLLPTIQTEESATGLLLPPELRGSASAAEEEVSSRGSSRTSTETRTASEAAPSGLSTGTPSLPPENAPRIPPNEVGAAMIRIGEFIREGGDENAAPDGDDRARSSLDEDSIPETLRIGHDRVSSDSLSTQIALETLESRSTGDEVSGGDSTDTAPTEPLQARRRLPLLINDDSIINSSAESFSGADGNGGDIGIPGRSSVTATPLEASELSANRPTMEYSREDLNPDLGSQESMALTPTTRNLGLPAWNSDTRIQTNNHNRVGIHEGAGAYSDAAGAARDVRNRRTVAGLPVRDKK